MTLPVFPARPPMLRMLHRIFGKISSPHTTELESLNLQAGHSYVHDGNLKVNQDLTIPWGAKLTVKGSLTLPRLDVGVGAKVLVGDLDANVLIVSGDAKTFVRGDAKAGHLYLFGNLSVSGDMTAEEANYWNGVLRVGGSVSMQSATVEMGHNNRRYGRIGYRAYQGFKDILAFTA